MWIVLKFGGTSVSSRARWETIASQIRQRRAEGFKVLVVCSAASGVSNLLERLPDDALAGHEGNTLEKLRAIHQHVSRELGVSLPESDLAEIARIAAGISLLREVTPRVRARLLATGELMLTRMGVDWLREQSIDASWVDARQHLRARLVPNDTRRYLSAECDYLADDTSTVLPEVAVTQGFIAADEHGDTVVLGRGGSDTSAAYFAARLRASRLEIWTDVPGMYTADPRLVPEARLLRQLDWDEAEELAAMGAKVLHPRCLPPVRDAGIPLHIRSTPEPEAEHTVIGGGAVDRPGVKAVAARRGIVLVGLETVGMWQEVGFLAAVFAVFARAGLSIDLVATSQASVTVSLDAAANVLDRARLDAVVEELRSLSRVTVIGPCAAVSLVGRHIRSTLHQLGPALEAFEEQRVHLVSQAANDLDFTVVVDEEHAERLVRDLHRLVLADVGASAAFGPQYRAHATPGKRWWEARREELLALSTPAYVYDLPTVRARARELRAMRNVAKAWYAMKANSHPRILHALHAEGIGLECVSAGELARARATCPGAPLLFTPNFAPRDEYVAPDATITVDNLYPLRAWPELFAGREFLLRIDPGRGRGHHRHVRTAGMRAKFGLLPEEIAEARVLAEACGARIIGLHAHVGSGIHDTSTWSEVGAALAGWVEALPDARVLNVGGGFGVAYRPQERTVRAADIDAALSGLPLEVWVEPGRWLVAEAGVLLARVTQVKSKGERTWVGVDTGMNALLRPALYGAWHEIVNLSRLGEAPVGPVDVVGPICESGDVLGRARALPRCEEGDTLLIGNAGAYGFAMASAYNLRPLPAEVVLD